MKTSRKILILAVIAALCLALAACGHAVPSGIVEMDPETGAGTASFTMVVPKNGAPDVGNNFVEPNGDDGPNNTGYITSPDALLTLMQNNVPEGFTVTVEEVTKMVGREDEFGDIDNVDEGSFDYTVTFSFNGIDDLNAKLKQWLPQRYWDAAAQVLTFEVKEATLSDGSLTLDMHILDVITQWAYTVISTDTTGAVVDGGSGFDYVYCYNLAKSTLTVKLGDAETTEQYDSVAMDVTAGKSGEPVATDPPATKPAETDPPATQPTETQPAPTTEPTDKPDAGLTAGAVAGMIAAVVAVAAVILVVVLRKRNK